MKRLLSLLTDFGIEDPFVGEMKAVIYSICPDAEVVDVTHAVEPYGIRSGAFLLASAAPYFPQGSVHVAVVDPGVGSKRRAIAIGTSRSIFVGPDNGLLIPASKREGILHVFELTNHSFMRQTVSRTFHGRDVFAPVAAYLACGTPLSEVGKELNDYVQLSFGEPEFDRQGVTCEILHVDRFGNAVTNVSEANLDKLSGRSRVVVRSGGRRFMTRFVETYSDLKGRELGLLVGSHGFLEAACLEASAARKLGAKTGDILRILT